MNKISIIVAIAENYAIGKDNQLLWHISDDLKRFKLLTSGHTVIMGKNTYFSLPVRPLPNRRNIVITDIKDDVIEGCTMAYSINEAVSLCLPDEETFVIGGASVYKQFMNISSKLYITKIYKTFIGDVFFPEFDGLYWQLAGKEDHFDEKSNLKYSFLTYNRKK